MKHLKTINELFDDQDMKDQMEIPHLKGEISYKDLVKDSSLMKEGDNLLGKISMNCPYISNLGFKRLSSNLLNIGFNHDMKVDGVDLFMYFYVEIMEHKSSNRYLCNSYAKCIKGGETLYNESVNLSIMPYESLINALNNQVLNLLIDFNRFTKENFNYVGSSIKGRDYMTGLNLGRN